MGVISRGILSEPIPNPYLTAKPLKSAQIVQTNAVVRISSK